MRGHLRPVLGVAATQSLQLVTIWVAGSRGGSHSSTTVSLQSLDNEVATAATGNPLLQGRVPNGRYGLEHVGDAIPVKDQPHVAVTGASGALNSFRRPRVAIGLQLPAPLEGHSGQAKAQQEDRGWLRDSVDRHIVNEDRRWAMVSSELQAGETAWGNHAIDRNESRRTAGQAVGVGRIRGGKILNRVDDDTAPGHLESVWGGKDVGEKTVCIKPEADVVCLPRSGRQILKEDREG